MKTFISLLLLVAVALLFVKGFDSKNDLLPNVSADDSVVTTPVEQVVEYGVVDSPWFRDDPGEVGFAPCEEIHVISAEDIPESEIKKERMISEVVMTWDMFLDDEGAPVSDPRRAKFEEYAQYLVDSVFLFQDRPTDIGGQLPKSDNIHFLISTMVTFESSVISGVVGKYKGNKEVGLMQTHGKALAGFSREQVKNNPKLGLLLGVRWLAVQIHTCYPNGAPENFIHDDWIGPLSAYAGGPKGIRTDGRCRRFTKSNERVAKMMMYENRVKHEMSLRGE